MRRKTVTRTSQGRRTRISRRSAIKGLIAAGGALVVSSRVLGLNNAASPSNDVTHGFIGVCNHRTEYNLRSHLELDDTQVVAVCDVFKSRANNAKSIVDQKYGTSDCKTYGDFREVLA